MDNETKQIFEQLIEAINNNRVDSSQLVEAVEKLNGPDWGMIILTTINIVAFILVAYAQLKQQKYQTKLQEQQNKQQEYELYRRIYSQVFELDFFNKTILFRIAAILICNEEKSLRLKLVDDIINEHDALSKRFAEWTIDIELKQCGEGLDVKYYYDAYQASKTILQMVKYFIEDELLDFDPNLVNVATMEYTVPLENFANIILQLFRGRNKELLRHQLLTYIQIVEETNKAQLLETIKDRITPTNTK